MASRLSVVVPTLNEENDLPLCLKSVVNFADEVVVVDSGSTDNTVKTAKDFGVKTIFHKFESFKDQRNFADTQTTGDWILSIEADVVITKELAEEIKAAISSTDFEAYLIERINYIWGKPIMHTDWGPKDDCHIWLYKKGSGEWKSDVHEEFITKGKVGKLKNRLIHHNYDSINEFIDKIDSYSNLAVKQRKFFPDYWNFIDFLKRYFKKLGFLDGYHGLFLSYLQSIYYVTLSVKRRLS